MDYNILKEELKYDKQVKRIKKEDLSGWDYVDKDIDPKTIVECWLAISRCFRAELIRDIYDRLYDTIDYSIGPLFSNDEEEE